MRKIMILLYGGVSYTLFLVAFLYSIGFVGDFGVPKTIDSGVGAPLVEGLAINAILLSLFAVQHSGMARRGFKALFSRFLPAEAERQTFVLATCAVMGLMFWQWQPLTDTVWQFESAVGVVGMYALMATGWAIVFLSTLMINHFELFGLRQTWLAFTGRKHTELGFSTPGFYKYVRHPIYVGFMIAMWSTPTMTVGHLFFAFMTTAYMIVAVKMFEERDLLREHGARYRAYMDQVGGFVPKGRYHDRETVTVTGD